MHVVAELFLKQPRGAHLIAKIADIFSHNIRAEIGHCIPHYQHAKTMTRSQTLSCQMTQKRPPSMLESAACCAETSADLN